MNGPLDIHPAVTASTIAASAAMLLVWLLAQLGLALPFAVAAAIVLLVSYATARMIRFSNGRLKATAGTLGAAAALVLVWVLQQFHIETSLELQGELVAVLTFAAGWIAPVTQPKK